MKNLYRSGIIIYELVAKRNKFWVSVVNEKSYFKIETRLYDIFSKYSSKCK